MTYYANDSDSSIELSDSELGFALAPDQPLVLMKEDGLLLVSQEVRA